GAKPGRGQDADPGASGPARHHRPPLGLPPDCARRDATGYRPYGLRRPRPARRVQARGTRHVHSADGAYSAAGDPPHLPRDPYADAATACPAGRCQCDRERAGETHWFLALMQAVREWPLPEESISGRTYRYLVGGEAFDWLLLAERLCDEIEALIPDGEREALLFHGCLPEEVDEHDVERLLGAKHRAHLNFVYGVRVEEALQLAVADEVHKERFASRVWENGRGDDEVFQRLYDS